jgi:hypothetical protein
VANRHAVIAALELMAASRHVAAADSWRNFYGDFIFIEENTP